MLAKSHLVTGACAVTVAGAVALDAAARGNELLTRPTALPLALLAAGLVMWGSIAPDLDHLSASATKAWTWRRPRARSRWKAWRTVKRRMIKAGTAWMPDGLWVSYFVRYLARVAYRSTAGREDAQGRVDPHRKLTHTLWGAVGAGALFALLAGPAVPWWFAALVFALTIGAAAYGWDRLWKWPAAVVAFVLAAVTPGVQEAWPLWWIAVSAGCVLHCAGDGCTEGGAPFWWLTPLGDTNARWREDFVLPAVLRFETGNFGEAVAVAVCVAGTGALLWSAWLWPLFAARYP